MNDKNKKKTGKKGWWVAAICFVIIASVYFTFKWEIYVRYYNLVNNHFNPGDSIYYYKMIKKEKAFDVPLWRTVTPKDNESKLKSYVVMCEWVSKDSLVKYNGYIGTYLSHKILAVKLNNDKFIGTNFYAVNPNQKITIRLFGDKPFVNNDNLPKGYQWADTTLYLIAIDAIGKK